METCETIIQKVSRFLELKSIKSITPNEHFETKIKELYSKYYILFHLHQENHFELKELMKNCAVLMDNGDFFFIPDIEELFIFLDDPKKALEILKEASCDFRKIAELFIKTEAIRYFTRPDYFSKANIRINKQLKLYKECLLSNKEDLIEKGFPAEIKKNIRFDLPFFYLYPIKLPVSQKMYKRKCTYIWSTNNPLSNFGKFYADEICQFHESPHIENLPEDFLNNIKAIRAKLLNCKIEIIKYLSENISKFKDRNFDNTTISIIKIISNFFSSSELESILSIEEQLANSVSEHLSVLFKTNIIKDIKNRIVPTRFMLCKDLNIEIDNNTYSDYRKNITRIYNEKDYLYSDFYKGFWELRSKLSRGSRKYSLKYNSKIHYLTRNLSRFNRFDYIGGINSIFQLICDIQNEMKYDISSKLKEIGNIYSYYEILTKEKSDEQLNPIFRTFIS